MESYPVRARVVRTDSSEDTMDTRDQLINQHDLERLAERMQRGIPEWERGHFIETVVPQLVARLQEYIRLEAQSRRAA